MNSKIGIIILAVVCIGLGVVLVATKKQAADEKRKDTGVIVDYSNRVEAVSNKLGEQMQVNVMLTNDLDVQKKQLLALTNKVEEVSATLAKTEQSLKASQEEVTRRDARITDLETQNRQLDERALELSTSITNLSAQIDETKRKLAASEGDKVFLQKELQRLMGEKADLERKFNDINVLRTQVAKLREEMNISRRLEWIRKGLFESADQRGAQQLLQRGPSATATPADSNGSHYNLNVEVGADGTVHVIPPLTNRPAAPPQPK